MPATAILRLGALLTIWLSTTAAAAPSIPHPPACDIKGNIGRHRLKLYYLPGHPLYERVRVTRRGERWFCSEAQARKAGWKKAGFIRGPSTKIDPKDCVIPPEAPPGCPIKGNISRNGRIYHKPCTRSYAETIIRPETGERWFCSEAQARKAGWRPPRR